MRLPNSERAIVHDAKVRDYLLSPDHPIGRFKARVFSAAGYTHSDWQRLRDDLVTLATVIDVTRGPTDAFGTRWIGPGELTGPAGHLRLVTVWLIPFEGAAPRLIAAYPERE
jgi:hypothetical protein